MKVSAIIPCRYGSSRFPGKPLAQICGKPMMEYPYQAAINSGLFEEVVIATDSIEIGRACDERGIKWVMTSKNHITGTDRAAEAVNYLKKPWDMLVNIQGDEPFIRIDDLVGLVKYGELKKSTVNGYSIIEDIAQITNHGVVKIALSETKKVIGLSRSQIPYINNKSSKVNYYRQTGLYMFKKDDLILFNNRKQSNMELAEGIEMLRLIENDVTIYGFNIKNTGLAVDTASDLEIAQLEMERIINEKTRI